MGTNEKGTGTLPFYFYTGTGNYNKILTNLPEAFDVVQTGL
jgi:hypothetical protein